MSNALNLEVRIEEVTQAVAERLKADALVLGSDLGSPDAAPCLEALASLNFAISARRVRNGFNGKGGFQ